MTIGDVIEQGYQFQLVMLMDREYLLKDVNEKGYHFWMVIFMDRVYLVMQMNWPFLVMVESHKLIKWC